MEFERGSFVEMEWTYSLLFLSLNLMEDVLNIGCPHQHMYFLYIFYARNSSSGGQNTQASTSDSIIIKMCSSSLICLITVIVASFDPFNSLSLFDEDLRCH